MIEQPNQSNPQGSQKVAGGRGPATPGCEVVCGSTPAGVPERCEDVSEKERSEIVRRSMSLWCSGRSGTPPGCGGFAAGYRGSLGATPGYRLPTLRVGLLKLAWAGYRVATLRVGSAAMIRASI